jgi:hypothetical protein
MIIGSCVFVRMQPDTVHRLAFVVEDVLATIIVPVDRPRGALCELAFAELHGKGLRYDRLKQARQTS